MISYWFKCASWVYHFLCCHKKMNSDLSNQLLFQISFTAAQTGSPLTSEHRSAYSRCFVVTALHKSFTRQWWGRVCIKHFNYITMREYTIPSMCLLKCSQHQVHVVYTHSHKTNKRNLYITSSECILHIR